MTDNNSSIYNDDEHFFDWSWYYIKIATDSADMILYGFSFVGILANIFVIFAGSLIYRKTTEPTHLIVSSIATADLATICVMNQLRVIMIKFLDKPLSKAVSMLTTLTWISYSASGFSLTLLNMEKLMYFCKPLRYDALITSTNCMVAIMACWVICLAYAIVMFASATNICGIDYCVVPSPTLYNLYIIFFCVIPVITSGVMSLCLFFTVRAKRLEQKHQRQISCNNNISGNYKLNFRKHLKCMAFIFSTTTWVVISLVPARIHYIFLFENSEAAANWFGLVTNCFLSLGPMINPLITILVYTCYREVAKKCLKGIVDKFRKSVQRNIVPEAVYV